MAAAAQDNCLAQPCRPLENRKRLSLHILQPSRVMHLERSVSIATCFAFGGIQPSDQIVPTLRQACAYRDLIHGRLALGVGLQVLQPPQLQGTRLAADHEGNPVVLPLLQVLRGPANRLAVP
jgi:hypothetical protein